MLNEREMQMALRGIRTIPKAPVKDEASTTAMLESDLKDEVEAIDNYTKHIAAIKDPEIATKLEEIRAEEQHHVEELKALLGGLNHD